MSFEGKIVVDMDSHIREYVDLDRVYGEYIDPAYRGSFELLSRVAAMRREAGRPTALFMNPDAIIVPSDESRPLGVYDTFSRAYDITIRARDISPERTGDNQIPQEVHWDPQIRIRDMDRAAIDISVIFPTHSASFCALSDVGFESALHRAYHRYMSDYCAEAGGRLRWAFIATMRDLPTTITEMKYWADQDHNFVGVLISPACPDGRLLDNPDLHPLFDCAQSLDIPVLIHGGVLRPPYTAGATELNNSGFILRAVYQTWGGMTALAALIGGGVFDLFPALRVGIFETTAGWMPWLIEQLDEGYNVRPDLVPNLKRRPRDVVAEGRLFHAVDTHERYIEHCVAELGEEMWVIGTDYPHAGTSWPMGVPQIAERTGLSQSAKVKILGSNALRMCPRLGGNFRES